MPARSVTKSTKLHHGNRGVDAIIQSSNQIHRCKGTKFNFVSKLSQARVLSRANRSFAQTTLIFPAKTAAVSAAATFAFVFEHGAEKCRLPELTIQMKLKNLSTATSIGLD